MNIPIWVGWWYLMASFLAIFLWHKQNNTVNVAVSIITTLMWFFLLVLHYR